MNRCVFLDRDGVINKDNPNYTFLIEKFEILPGVIEGLHSLKKAGFKLVVITNQSGIAQGIYTIPQMKECHQYFQEQAGGIIDAFYYSPYHPSVTDSLLRKPGTLMFEKAIARFQVDVKTSWMVGDRGRDLIPAKKLGLKTIQVGDEIPVVSEQGDYKVESLLEASGIILQNA
jgi:D-glycero-D-manno-heptose 1,7-bisphosphate phosphatase